MTKENPIKQSIAWLVEFENGEQELHFEEQPVGEINTPLYTTPPQRKPLTDEMRKQMKERCDSMEMRGAFADGWLSAEAAHGIKE